MFAGTGRYKIIRELGAGGMGVVYEAFDRERATPIALKTLREVGPAAIARFKQEFRALANVVHPSLVNLYELVSDRDQLFFTMELVDGVHFDRWVSGTEAGDEESTRTIPPEETDETWQGPKRTEPKRESVVIQSRLRAGLRQLAQGIAAIHDAGMLHRDLKPSNVLVDRGGRVVILDFGLVTELADESTQASEERPLQGTYPYMSPEQGARAPLTPASDWYSLGVILYRILTGRMPFLGGRDDVLMDKQRFEPPPPREVATMVPSDLDALCSELLRRKPEARPAAAEILRRLGSAVETGALASRSFASAVAYDTLIGRDAELAQLAAAHEQAKSGEPVLVRMFGPSGVGKSRTTRAFIESLPAEDNVMVLRGRCYEQESVPFKAIDSLVDALAGHLSRMSELEVEGLMPRDGSALARLFPTLRQVDAFTSRRRRELPNASDPIELRRRGFAAFRELLARIADRRPLVLVIDDLQWGDVDSATLLATLLHPPDAPALMLLASFRSEGRESNPFLAAFDEQLAAGSIPVIDLAVGPLTAEDARRLATVHLGSGADALAQAERVVSEAQGNPYLVEELARHVRERNDQEAVSLDQVLRARLLRLSKEAAHLLSIIAVAGRPLAQSIALRAANANDPAVLAQLKVGSFVRTRSVGELRLVEPYHDQVREAALALLSRDERSALHQRLAEMHEALPNPDPEMLAYHYGQAGDRRRAATLSVQAARRASDALAFDRAALLYRNAIAMTSGVIDRRLHVALGETLANAGRGRESADAYLAALDGAPPAEALELKCRAASQLLFSGHIDRGLAALGEVIEAVGLPSPSTHGKTLVQIGLARLQLFLRGLKYREVDEREVPASQLVRLDVAFAAAEGLGTADPIRATAFQARSLLLALRTGEPKRVVRALATEVAFVSLRGISAQKRTAQIQQMLDQLATRLGDPASLGLAEGARAVAAFNEGRWADSEASCRRAEVVFREQCTGLRWELATAQLFRGLALAMMGRVRDLVSEFPLLVKDAQERGDLFAATSIRACLGFYAPLMRNDVSRAYREVDGAIAAWSVEGFHVQHANALNSRVSIDLYRRDGLGALRRIDETMPALKRSLLLRVQTLRTVLTGIHARALVTAAQQDGDHSRLRQVLAIARRLEKEGVAYCTAEATMLRGAVAHLSGDADAAVALLERADAESRTANLMLNNAAIRRARGLLIGGSEGAALIEAADEFCRGEGIQRPERVTGVFAPSFDSALDLLDGPSATY